MQKSRNTYIHIQQNIFALKVLFYIQQKIVFIQLQGTNILVNCQGNKFIQRTYIYSQKV